MIFSIVRRIHLLITLLAALSPGLYAGETAVLAPDGSEISRGFATALAENLQKAMPVTDSDLASAALNARKPETPYNLTAREAKNLGSAIGCAYFVLVRGGLLRRSSFERKQFFEGFAAIYLVESRSGGMILWKLFNSEQDDQDSALAGLVADAPQAAAIISRSIDENNRASIREKKRLNEEGPDEDGIGVRAPLPFRRITPAYTKTADYYGIEATVDIEVSIDREGRVTATKIVRWAGFGLDESVDKAVREMNWRAADRRGEYLAMTVLLRYNFKDLNDSGLQR